MESSLAVRNSARISYCKLATYSYVMRISFTVDYCLCCQINAYCLAMHVAIEAKGGPPRLISNLEKIYIVSKFCWVCWGWVCQSIQEILHQKPHVRKNLRAHMFEIWLRHFRFRVQLTATAVSGNTRVLLHVPYCSADVVQRLLCINILVLHVDPLECPRINPVHQLKRKSGRTLSELTIASIASEPDWQRKVIAGIYYDVPVFIASNPGFPVLRFEENMPRITLEKLRLRH